MDDFEIAGKHFYVKRDELIDPRYSGNKLRKLYSILKAPSGRFDTIVSYGGTQSNAMLSIAYMCKSKGWNFHYYCKTIPRWLKEKPMGNLKMALDLGMVAHEVSPSMFYDRVQTLESEYGNGSVFIPQGGADPVAEEGVGILADEILFWSAKAGLKSFTVATPSGTGTTALYLRRHLPLGIDVVTTPVVGDESALKTQLGKLEADESRFPIILDSMGKWPFAKPKKEYLDIWRRLKDSGILFDLVYAPKMWLELIEAYELLKGPILYVHSGGVSGNETQLEKYRYKGYL